MPNRTTTAMECHPSLQRGWRHATRQAKRDVLKFACILVCLSASCTIALLSADPPKRTPEAPAATRKTESRTNKLKELPVAQTVKTKEMDVPEKESLQESASDRSIPLPTEEIPAKTEAPAAEPSAQSPDKTTDTMCDSEQEMPLSEAA